jgi:glucose-6-phosphate 1-dehydrogenase
LDAERQTQGNYLFYLATPPNVFAPIAELLRQGRPGAAPHNGSWTRLIIEKPFGHDLESAQQLNKQLQRVFDEQQIYRIDHYLGKETVQNILVFPLWQRHL